MRRDVACVHMLHPSYYTLGPCPAAGRAGDRFSASDNCSRQAAGGLERYDMRIRSCVKGLLGARSSTFKPCRRCRSSLLEGFDGVVSVRRLCVPYGAPLNSQHSAVHVRWQMQSEALYD